MRIVVLGAGSVGAFVGGSLLAAGADVSFIGRALMRRRIETYGLHLTSLHGGSEKISVERIAFSETPEGLSQADLIIVATKSSGTVGAAAQVKAYAPSTALILSLQNGVTNVDLLRQALPGYLVLGGMVPFNVVQLPDGRIHRATGGELIVEAHERWGAHSERFVAAKLPLIQHTGFIEIQWGKLLLNLNNAVNALSGRPLKEQMSDGSYRWVLAALVEEALVALTSAGIQPAALGAAPASKLPALLRLPDAEFFRVANAMTHIDPEARSSMWEDLEAGRPTEVDELNGAVVNLALAQGGSAPANEAIRKLVKAAERGGPRGITGQELITAVCCAR